jgi:hypothetical protein
LLFLIQSIYILVNCNNFTTVSELDLNKYSGHWYQVYASPFDYVFQGYGKCITADYEIINSNNVSVLHLWTFKTPFFFGIKKSKKVIADFTPRHTYLPIREYRSRSYSLD